MKANAIVENIRDRVIAGKSQAKSEIKDFAKRGMTHSLGLSTGADWAFDRMLEWLKDPKVIGGAIDDN